MSVYFMCSLCAHSHAIMPFGLCEGKPITNHHHHISVLFSDAITTRLILCYSIDFDHVTKTAVAFQCATVQLRSSSSPVAL